MHRHTGWLTHRQTDGNKKERQSKTQARLSMLVPQILSCVLSTRYGGWDPKGFLVAS